MTHKHGVSDSLASFLKMKNISLNVMTLSLNLNIWFFVKKRGLWFVHIT